MAQTNKIFPTCCCNRIQSEKAKSGIKWSAQSAVTGASDDVGWYRINLLDLFSTVQFPSFKASATDTKIPKMKIPETVW